MIKNITVKEMLEQKIASEDDFFTFCTQEQQRIITNICISSGNTHLIPTHWIEEREVKK